MNLVEAIHLEIQFDQDIQSISILAQGLKSPKTLKHLRITLQNTDVIPTLSLNPNPSGPLTSFNIMPIFDLDLQTLTVRFGSSVGGLTKTQYGTWPQRPSVHSMDRIALHKQVTFELDVGVKRIKGWLEYVFSETEMRQVLGKVKEMIEEAIQLPKGAQRSFKSIQYDYPPKAGTRRTICPDWPLLMPIEPGVPEKLGRYFATKLGASKLPATEHQAKTAIDLRNMRPEKCQIIRNCFAKRVLDFSPCDPADQPRAQEGEEQIIVLNRPVFLRRKVSYYSQATRK